MRLPPLTMQRAMPARQTGRLRWTHAVLLVALLAAAGGGAWWWQRQQPAAASDAAKAGAAGRAAGGPGRFGAGNVQPVSVGTVQRGDVRVVVQAIGTMSARATAVVRARVSGELVALHFQEGEEVRAGQLLAEIDPRSYQAALAQAEGVLRRDQALLRNAQLDLKRYQELQEHDAIAGQQVDAQASLVRQLEGTVAADQAQVDAARLQLGYTKVVAPFSGRLGLRQADLGNVVGPTDANGIVSINQVRPMDASFAVPEVHLPQMRKRLAAGDALPVELWDRDFRQLLGRGRVVALDNAVDVATGTVKVKATVANDDRALYPNQFVNVRLQVNRLESVLTVPTTAVQNQSVYVVQDDSTVTQRRLRVGVVDGDRVSVEGDLREGDRVVTDGIDRLREGTKVAVIDSAAVTRADQATQEQAARRRAVMASLSPEERARLEKMTPEERRAFLRAKAAQAPAAAASAPAAPAAPAASGAAAGALAPRAQTADAPPAVRRDAPLKVPADASPTRAAQSSAAPALPAAEGARPVPPQVQALLEQMPPDERARVLALPPEERRAYFRERLQSQGAGAAALAR